MEVKPFTVASCSQLSIWAALSKRREPADAGDPPKPQRDASAMILPGEATPEELFVPGTMYYLKRTVDTGGGGKPGECCYSLWEREPGEHFQRIILSGNLISDHKCDSHYYALRDVLKGLPASGHRTCH